jgi:cell division protein FtsB
VQKTEVLKARNTKLASEVLDLKTGTGAIEERARYELGMVKENEVFIQVLSAGTAAPELAVKPPPAVEPLPPVRSTP